MLLTKKDSVRGVFVPIDTQGLSQAWTWGVRLFFVLFFAVVVWNLNYMSNMTDMSQAIIDSYINTGDAMSEAFYKKMVEFEKDNLFSSSTFCLFALVMSLFSLVALFTLLLEDFDLRVAEAVSYGFLALALVCSWVGIWKYSDKSNIEKANVYVYQGVNTKTALIKSFYEPSCYHHKHGRSCSQKMAVLIDDQPYELSTSKVDFYKVGQELEVKYAIYRTQLTHERKVNIVY